MNENEFFVQARKKAIDRLNRKELSSQEMRCYLIEKGVSKELASRVVLDLQQKNYLQDERFARILIRHLVLIGKGPHFIRHQLMEKGIRLDLNEIQSLSFESAQTSEFDTVKAIVERKYPRALKDKNEAQRAIRALLRRGFNYSIIRKIIISSSEVDE